MYVFMNILENLSYFMNFNFLSGKKHSTNHAILSIVEDIHHILDKNNFVCGVFIDLEKAFDTINRDILIKTRLLWNLWYFSTYGSNLI